MATYVNNLSFIQPVENQAIISDGGALMYTAPANTFARVQIFVYLGEDIVGNPVNAEVKVGGQTIFQQDGGPFFEFYSDVKIIAGASVEFFVDGTVSPVFCSVTGSSFTTEIDY